MASPRAALGYWSLLNPTSWFPSQLKGSEQFAKSEDCLENALGLRGSKRWMGKISEVKPLRFLLLCRRMILLKPLAAVFVCWPAGLFSCEPPRCCQNRDETLLSARPEYIFSHLCPRLALSESPSLNTVMNRGISGGKVFYQSPDEDLNKTLDFFTYLAPRRSRMGGRGGGCV